jgi:hypothetical protein
LAYGTGVHRIRHEAQIDHENVAKGADVRVAAPSGRLGGLGRRCSCWAAPRKASRWPGSAYVGFRACSQASSPRHRSPRGVAAITRPARGRQAPPAARYYGRYHSRSAKRTGGLRGSSPREDTVLWPALIDPQG